MIDNVVARIILGLHGWTLVAIVFALPLLESSAFVGFVFPGEIAVLLGGVLAAQHRASLPAVLAAGICGAILGDTIGYWVGHRYGQRLLSGRLGRFIKPEFREKAEQYLARHGSKAVLLGRFTAALRVMVPGLAGMARMPYRTFAAYNIAGGVIWASGMVLLGYLLSANWPAVVRWASRIGPALLVLIVLTIAVRFAVWYGRRHVAWFQAAGHRLADTRPARWVWQRFPTQVAWLRRRFDPGTPTGLRLTAAVAVAVLLAWTFGGLAQDVLTDVALARLDPGMHAFAVSHRTEWLTAILSNVTWLGSNWLLLPLLAGATVLLLRRGDRRTAVTVWVAYLGAIVLYLVVKVLVHRPRPPAADAIGAAGRLSFPAGHAVQALTAWGVLAVVLSAGHIIWARTVARIAATIVVLLVGAASIYLGAHWFTDVLAGYALAGAWLAVLFALRQRYPQRR
jgi:undecaprenyl-diphosphatase